MKQRTMLQTLLNVGLVIVLAVNISIAQGDRLQAPVPTTDAQVLREILEELRQLKTTVQRGQQNTLRGQLLVEQIRFQQDRVDRLSRDLDDARLQLTNMKAAAPQMQEQLRAMESILVQEHDAQRRSQLEAEVNNYRSTLALQTMQQSQSQEREGQLDAKLREEEVALKKLKENLLGIEREVIGKPVTTTLKR